MARFTPIRVNYVALYFRDWLPVFQTLSTIECGIYWRLCCFIYEAGGRLENKTALLAPLSGLSELEFGTYWPKLKSKFVHEGDYLYHKRCTKELKATDVIIKGRQKGGFACSKTRIKGQFVKKDDSQLTASLPPAKLEQYNVTNTIHKSNITNTSDNNVKEARTINPIFQKTLDSLKPSDSFLKSSSPSDSTRSPQAGSSRSPHSPQHLDCREHESREGDKLVLYGALQDFFNIRSNADRTSLDNICKWAVNHQQAGKEFYRKVIDLADEAKRKAKHNRWGYFFDVLRRQLGYVPGKTVD
jgi:uncharacterized protein YdaU (DUF1376 family)